MLLFPPLAFLGDHDALHRPRPPPLGGPSRRRGDSSKDVATGGLVHGTAPASRRCRRRGGVHRATQAGAHFPLVLEPCAPLPVCAPSLLLPPPLPPPFASRTLGLNLGSWPSPTRPPLLTLPTLPTLPLRGCTPPPRARAHAPAFPPAPPENPPAALARASHRRVHCPCGFYKGALSLRRTPSRDARQIHHISTISLQKF